MAYNAGTDPTLAEFISRKLVPEVFSKDVIMHTMASLVIVNAFNTTYKNDLKKGTKVWLPTFTEGSATEVTPNTEAAVSDLTTTAGSITVDKWYYAAAELSDLMEVESIVDYLGKAAESLGYTIKKTVDSDVASLFSTLSSSSVYGSDGQTFDDDIFLALVEGLDEADVPPENRTLIGDPSTRVDILKIDKFVRSDYVRDAKIPTGKIGTLYDASVLISGNLTAATTGAYGVYAHKDALGIAIQKNPRTQIVPMPWKFITKLIVDAAWGADEVRDTFGRAFYTRKA